MKKYLLISIFTVLLGMSIGGTVLASSGFVPKQIWYSKEKLAEGDTVDIHTSVWNAESDTVLVKVDFYDYATILGSREIQIKPQELKDVYITWKVTAGEHIISAKIVSSVVVVGEDKKDVSLRYTKTDSDKQDVEKEKIIVVPKEENPKTVEDNFVTDVLPENITNTITAGYNSVDDFRVRTSDKLSEEKIETKAEVESLKAEPQVKEDLVKSKRVEDIVKKPFAYAKLFVVSVLAFIFENKIVFYGLIALIVFYLIRAIFRSFRHK